MTNSDYDRIKKWDKRYMNIAKQVAAWSKDPCVQVGAIIVGQKGQIVSQGYNGFPRNIQDTPERYFNKEVKHKYVIHAEVNAILNALYNGASVSDCTLYVYGKAMCHECAKCAIQSGITRVVYNTKPEGSWLDSCNLALDILQEAGINVVYLENE